MIELPVIVQSNAFPPRAAEVKRAMKWVIAEHSTKTNWWVANCDYGGQNTVNILPDRKRGNRYITDAYTLQEEAEVLMAFAAYLKIVTGQIL